MAKGPPKLSNDASEQARNVHAFLLSREMTMRGWASAAGLSANVLSELFSGRTRSLKYSTLRNLATAAHATTAEIVGHEAAAAIKGEALVRLRDVIEAVVSWATRHHIEGPERAASEIVDMLDAV